LKSPFHVTVPIFLPDSGGELSEKRKTSEWLPA